MVFVDTSYLFAAGSPKDSNHEEARELSGLIAVERFLTTNHVLGEAWILALRRSSHARAMQLVSGVRRSAHFTIAHPDHEAEERAWTWLFRHDEREYSFVDALSFDVMRERGIEKALTFDAGFEAAGFHVVRA